MKSDWKKTFRDLQIKSLQTLYKLDIPGDLYLLFLAGMTGVLTGFGAYLLNVIINTVHFVLYNQGGADLIAAPVMNYLRILFPAFGGLLVGLLIYYFSPEVKGHGIPGVMDAVVNKGGVIRRRVAALTSINSGLTLGSGGSAGKEGPIVQVGAAIGSGIGQFFKVSQSQLKILVGCGAAAGLAAVFNAPIGGVIFAIEVILADFSLTAFTPIVISSVIATAISRYMIGSSPLFAIPTYALNSPLEFPLYLTMGLLGGALSVFFIKTLYSIEDVFEQKIDMPFIVKPVIGGLLTGILAFKFPELYGFDDSATHSALTGHHEVYLLLILMLAKILATSFTLGSGSTGGLFTPSLFIGAMFGAAFGAIAGYIFPDFTAPPGAYALVGMGVVVAGTVHAPLSALIMIFEVTGDYKIILPLMLGTVTSTLTARWMKKESIYTMKISLFSNRLEGGRNMDILQNHRINSLIRTDIPIIQESTGFDEILNDLMESSYSTFPVVNKKNHVTGIIALRDLRPVLFDRDVAPLLLATDIMSENIFVLHPQDTLADALRKMEMDDRDLLPVVDSREKMNYLGVVSKEQILDKYTKENFLLSDTGD
ncbi:MAG: chloride channel protein [Calditrichaceae bacterium]|nr:chloride channel protein [Calditrichaceae bacterium]RQV96190.1 MAG: chloride channel protein [Calditrichota bacterium]